MGHSLPRPESGSHMSGKKEGREDSLKESMLYFSVTHLCNNSLAHSCNAHARKRSAFVQPSSLGITAQSVPQDAETKSLEKFQLLIPNCDGGTEPQST